MKKTLICTAVGASLALGPGLAPAKYTGNMSPFALVPYVVKDANRTTVVSVVMTDAALLDYRYQPGAAPAGGEDPAVLLGSRSIHLQYWTKSTTAAHTDACKSSSLGFPVTPNDVVSFDTAGLFGQALFNDVTNPAPHDFSIGGAAPQHGYLFIESGAVAAAGSLNAPQATIMAPALIRAVYWHELDLANGGAVGDMAPMLYSPDLTANGYPLSPDWVLFPGPIKGGQADLRPATPVVFYRPGAVEQAWTVTPLGSDMLNNENNQAQVQVFKANGRQGAYDRNENEYDGTDPIAVRCVAKIPASTLLGRVYTRASWANQGGWGFLANLGDGDENFEYCCGTTTADLATIVYQVDSGTLNGRFMTNATRIPTFQGPEPDV